MTSLSPSPVPLTQPMKFMDREDLPDEASEKEETGYGNQLEYAKTGRSACKGAKPCKGSLIAKGDLRYGIADTSGRHDTPQIHWRHWGCVTDQNISKAIENQGDRPNVITGFDTLTEEDQVKVITAWDLGHVDPVDKAAKRKEDDALQKMSLLELKEKCEAAGLKKTGKKDEMIARLREHADATPAAGPSKTKSDEVEAKKITETVDKDEPAEKNNEGEEKQSGKSETEAEEDEADAKDDGDKSDVEQSDGGPPAKKQKTEHKEDESITVATSPAVVANDEVEDAPTDDSEDEPSLPSSGEKRKTRGGGKGKKKAKDSDGDYDQSPDQGDDSPAVKQSKKKATPKKKAAPAAAASTKKKTGGAAVKKTAAAATKKKAAVKGGGKKKSAKAVASDDE